MFYFGQTEEHMPSLEGLDTKLNKKVSQECGLIMARVSQKPKDYAAGIRKLCESQNRYQLECVLNCLSQTIKKHKIHRVNF